MSLEKPDIVDVISRYIELKKVGSNYAGKCPFHFTNTYDAFRVSPKLQIFKCFNCGRKGDVIKFIMLIEGCSFLEAINKLQIGDFNTYHFRRKSFKPSKSDNYSFNYLQYQSIFFKAIEFYKKNLQSSYTAKNYLKQRNIIDINLIQNLSIGYAPNQGLVRFLNSNGFKVDDILHTALIREGKYGLYDFFRNRIVFPVFDKKGFIVTFTSRSINPYDKIRHLHLPFKIANFYNEQALNNTYVIICEGIFDCLSLLQEGFNAVSVFGTGGLKPEMAIKLRNIKEIYICFDRDENLAGHKGIQTVSKTLKSVSISSFYPVMLPFVNEKKVDINDLFSKHSFTKEDFAFLMEKAKENEYVYRHQ